MYRILFAQQIRIKIKTRRQMSLFQNPIKWYAHSPSVLRTNQNSRNSVRVRWVFAEPIKTSETQFAFAECLQNQSKLQKPGSCSPNQSKLQKLSSCSPSVCRTNISSRSLVRVRRTNQNSRNLVHVHRVFTEPVKTLETQIAFAECSQNQSKL